MTYSESLSQLRMAAKAAEDKKGEDILGFDVRGQSSITDSFLFISGTSHVHIRAIEDSVREELKKLGATLNRTDGQRGHVWRALDYGTFIVHIMDRKTREFYAMERLWERAKPLSLNLDSGPSPKAKLKKTRAKKIVRKTSKKAKKRRPSPRRKR